MHRLTIFSLDHPKLVGTLLLLTTLVLAAGVPRVEAVYGYRVLIGDDHPAIRALEGFIDRFGGGLPVHIAWECGEDAPCSSAFDTASLRMAHAVETELASAAGVGRVAGPATAPLLVPGEYGYAVRRFVENGEIPADVEALGERAAKDRFWAGTFVSKDRMVGAIIVQATDTKPATDHLIVDAIETALAPFEAEGFRFHLTGGGASNVIPGRDLAASTNRLIPFTVLAITLVLLMLSRSILQTAVALATMGVAILWTVGVMGFLGWPKDGIHEVLVPLVMVVGICDAIHFLSRYAAALPAAEARAHDTRRTALVQAAREVGPACLITTLTTGAAFLSFATSSLDAFVRLGITATLGVFVCLLLTFSLLPLLVRQLPIRSHNEAEVDAGWQAALQALCGMTERNALLILGASIITFSFFTYGWVNFLRVEVDWRQSIGEDTYLMKSVSFMEDHLAPARNLEIELTLPDGARLEDPETLRTVARIADRLPRVDGLGEATSVVDLVSQLNRLLHDDDPAFDRIGDTAAANGEILELVSLDDATILGSWVSLDRSRLRISIDSEERPQSQIDSALLAAERIIAEEAPPSWRALLTGYAPVGQQWLVDVQSTQARSFPTALALVFVLVAGFLRSIRLALVALLPTLLPVVVTLGLLGWLGLPLDIGRAMIAAVMLGIGVDDSIHILLRYQRQRRSGLPRGDAVREAICHTGRAVITTSFALSLGFLTLGASAWHSIASFGVIISMGIVGALLSALLVLPALIFLSARERVLIGPPHPSHANPDDDTLRAS